MSFSRGSPMAIFRFMSAIWTSFEASRSVRRALESCDFHLEEIVPRGQSRLHQVLRVAFVCFQAGDVLPYGFSVSRIVWYSIQYAVVTVTTTSASSLASSSAAASASRDAARALLSSLKPVKRGC